MSPEQFAQMLEDASDYCDSGEFEDALRETLPVFTDGFDQNFHRAEDSSGVPWPPRKDKKPHPLLVLSGALIESARDTGGAGNIHQVSGRLATLGIDGSVIPYAAAQNYGYEPRNLPAREYLYAAEDTIQVAAEAFRPAASEAIFPAL